MNTGKKIKDICERLWIKERFVSSEFVESKPIDYESVNMRIYELRGIANEYLTSTLT